MNTCRHVLFRAGFVLVLAAALAAPTRATAGFVFVTSEPTLSANDSVDWGSLGSLTTPNFQVTSAGGTQVNGLIPPSYYNINNIFHAITSSLTQLNGSPAIQIVGEATFGLGGVGTAVSITFTFSEPVFAAGANVNFNDGGFLSGSRYVIATDTTGTAQTFNNISLAQGFFGVTSDTANLSSLEFVDVGFSNGSVADAGLTIGKLELDSPTASAVPEPGGVTLAGIGIVGLIGYAWRRRRRVAV
jgi:hypothetical protein